MANDSDTKIGPALLTVTATLTVAMAVAIYNIVSGEIWSGLASLTVLGLGGTSILSAGFYLLMLGDEEDYQRLRGRLGTDGGIMALYTARLKALLNGADRFFGDKDHPGQRAFGLQTPKPLWTADSYDRNLLLALIYPIVTIFVLWVLFGEAGQAEKALGLKEHVSGIRRIAIFLGVAVSAYSTILAIKLRGWKRLVLFAIVMTLYIPDVANLLINIFISKFAHASPSIYDAFSHFRFDNRPSPPMIGAIVGAIIWSKKGSGGILTLVVAVFTLANVYGEIIFPIIAILSFFRGYIDVLASFFISIYICSIFSVYFTIFNAGIMWNGVNSYIALCKDKNMYASCIFTMSLLLLTVCLLAPSIIDNDSGWREIEPILLFYGLLTLVNAPIDWVALGLTRALLRRGIEKGGLAPVRLALLDAAAALVLIALLAVAMVEAVQAFNWMAEQGKPGGTVLDVRGLLDDLATNPVAPHNWWLYALLLSSLIPSLVNLTLCGASVMRGSSLALWLVQRMPADRLPSPANRMWMAGLLALQWPVGMLLALGLPVGLWLVLIKVILPKGGLELLDLLKLLLW